MIGVEFNKVKVVSYNPEWAELYRQESEKIQSILEHVKIEHIGSTAIPGMPSKPILDIMVITPNDEINDKLIQDLSKIDYHYEPDDPVPERYFFVKPPLKIPYRTHHLSVTAEYSTFWHNNLAFREYMLCHSDEMKKYGELKMNFALKYPNNRGLYTAAKQPYIKDILKKALLEFENK